MTSEYNYNLEHFKKKFYLDKSLDYNYLSNIENTINNKLFNKNINDIFFNYNKYLRSKNSIFYSIKDKIDKKKIINDNNQIETIIFYKKIIENNTKIIDFIDNEFNIDK